MKYGLIIILTILVTISLNNVSHYVKKELVRNEDDSWIKDERAWLFNAQQDLSMIKLCAKIGYQDMKKEIKDKCLNAGQNLVKNQ